MLIVFFFIDAAVYRSEASVPAANYNSYRTLCFICWLVHIAYSYSAAMASDRWMGPKFSFYLNKISAFLFLGYRRLRNASSLRTGLKAKRPEIKLCRAVNLIRLTVLINLFFLFNLMPRREGLNTLSYSFNSVAVGHSCNVIGHGPLDAPR